MGGENPTLLRVGNLMSKAEPTGDNGYVREPDRDYEGLKDLNTKQVAVIKKIEYTF